MQSQDSSGIGAPRQYARLHMLAGFTLPLEQLRMKGGAGSQRSRIGAKVRGCGKSRPRREFTPRVTEILREIANDQN
jgi:hypothetical protein